MLCVVPRRLEEGEEVKLAKPELELALGQPVLFPLFTSTVRGKDKPGDVLTIPPNQLLQLPPLHTVLRGGKRSGTKSVPVTLSARCTEIGTLELYCVAKDGDNRWRLEFNVRDIVTDAGEDEGESRSDAAATDVFPEELVQRARRSDSRDLRRRRRSQRIDEGARGRSGKLPARMADGAMSPTLDVSGRAGRSPHEVRPASQSLVSPRGLLPAAGLWRFARSLPHRAIVEDAGGRRSAPVP